MGRLNALTVKNAKAGRHGDGAGLYLLVSPTGAKSWMIRIQSNGKRRDIGLGSTAALSLAEAREKATALRKHALNGRDPIAERDRDLRPTPTFRDACKHAHTALSADWAVKNAAAFLTSLETHAWPAIGDLRVDTIESRHIRDMLEPIWTTKPEVARKVRMRTAQVLNFSHSKGWRPLEAPGRAITIGLLKQPAGKHFKAMPYKDVPAFMKAISLKAPTNGRLGLTMLILTAARPGEIRAMRWEQIDLDAASWNRPAAIMKGGVEHMVTLSTPAVSLLREVRSQHKWKPTDLVFPGRGGAMMSDMTMKKVVTAAGHNVDPHGFRSSFRDWAAETMPEIPDAVAEAALAHSERSKVVRAYKRTSYVELRRIMLEAWGAFVSVAEPIAS